MVLDEQSQHKDGLELRRSLAVRAAVSLGIVSVGEVLSASITSQLTYFIKVQWLDREHRESSPE